VMMSDGQPVVIDFGIAQLPETTRLTLTGMFMGTPGYLAPEVIEGSDSGPASDVHSWGATVAFAATGRPPYGTGPFETIFYRIMHGAPDLETMPASLQPVVLDALARQAAMRPSAADIGRRIAALDPDGLIPSPPSAPATLVAGGPVSNGPMAGGPNGGPPAPFAGIVRTVAEQQDWQDRYAWPSTTPLRSSSPSDVRDLLPPVSGPVTPPASAGPAHATGLAGAPVPAPDARSTVEPVSTWSPLVIATVAMVVAVSVMAPIIGTGLAIALLVALRAVTITGRQLARRSADGRRAGQSLLGVALYPLAVFRAVVGLVLVAPVGVLAFCVVAAITIIAVPVHPLPRAVAFGAGALVAVFGLGPGSSGSRKALAGLYTAAARTASLRTVAYVGIVAVAIWATLTAWYQSPAPAFWPVSNLHHQLVQLPTIHSVLTDVRQNLLSLVHHIGL
jgi:Protein kinase domain